MASGVVVDTDLTIDFLRGRGAGVHIVRSLLREGRLRFTAVTGFELSLGTDFLDRHDDIMRLLRSRTLPLDLPSSLRGGEVAAGLQARGEAIGFADSLQAGICLRNELPLATRNRRHFDRVSGLVLIDIDHA